MKGERDGSQAAPGEDRKNDAIGTSGFSKEHLINNIVLLFSNPFSMFKEICSIFELNVLSSYLKRPVILTQNYLLDCEDLIENMPAW